VEQSPLNDEYNTIFEKTYTRNGVKLFRKWVSSVISLGNLKLLSFIPLWLYNVEY